MGIHSEEDRFASMKKVLVAVPAYGGQIPTDWMMAFINTQQMGIEKDIIFGIHIRSNSSLIPKCRDEMIHTFLFKSDYDYLLCIDADVVWNPDQVLSLIEKAERYGTIFGPYPIKSEENKFFIEPMTVNGEFIESEGLVRIKSGPAGFMMVSRETLLKVRELNQFLEYDSDEFDERVCSMFMPMIYKDRYRGEDISFCLRLLHAEERMWADTSIELTHVGTKKYKQSFSEFLENYKLPEEINGTSDSRPEHISAR